MSGLEPGARIADRYIVRDRLGSGGMATVYRCVDSMLGLDVAVKLLHHHLMVDNAEVVARFRREADVMAHLSHPMPHPNVVAVRDVVSRPDQMAIVMELVAGGFALDELLSQSGPLTERRAIAVMSGVLSGMQTVHEHGVVHRDIKPSNLLLARDENGALVPKVTDFGIAKWSGREDLPLDDGTLTQTKSMFGSPAYMAPELFDSAAAASPASDLYALGVVLYELLVGQPPFVVDSMPSHVMRVSTQSAPSPRAARPELSGDVERAIGIALAKDPHERFRSAEDFARALEGRGVDVSADTWAVPDIDPTRFGRDYRVDRRIGRGPSSTVFACTDESLDVPVAVKMLRGNDPGRRARLLEQAKSQAPLHQGRPHRAIAAIRHIIDQDEVTALVVEQVDGLPLDRYVGEARPDLATVLRLFGEATDALRRAHAYDVLHRNLKPNNVLVTWVAGEVAAQRRPRVKLCDFGMDCITSSTRVESATRAGTQRFLAPELFTGGEPSQASDVYSLGVLLLLAVRGRLPADLPEGPEAARALRDAVPDVPTDLRTLIEAMLSDAPVERPDLDAVFDRLNDVLLGLTGEALPIGSPEDLDLGPVPSTPTTSSRSPVLLVGLVIVLVLALAAALAWILGSASSAGTKDTASAETTDSADTVVDEAETDAANAPALDVPPTEPDWVDVSDDVARLILSKNDDFNACLETAFTHEKAATLESASGSLEVDIEVDAEGGVTDVIVIEDSLAVIELGPCVGERIRTWAFPASGRAETWSKKWLF